MPQSPTPSCPTSSPPPRPFSPEWGSVDAFNRLARADPEFRAFALQVYGYLDRLPAGRALRLSGYEGQRLEWIVRTCVAFMAEDLHWLEFRFADDGAAFIHEAHPPRWLHALRAIVRRRMQLEAPRVRPHLDY